MNQSIISKLGSIVKKVTGIQDIGLFKKEMHKKFGKLIYHKKYTAEDIVHLMCEMGMKKGSVVCIHSSMKEFYNYQGTAEELIQCIMDVITKEGTLIMPTFPAKILADQPGYVFDVDNDKTGAGYLAETFRKTDGVIRSINVQHAVSVWGNHAEWLIKDHHKCRDCWDKNSPWQRMMELNALVFNLGMPHAYIGTFHHCVESVLQFEHPYWAQFFNEKRTYSYYDLNHNVQTYEAYCCTIDRRMRESNLFKHFGAEDWNVRKLSNLEIKVFYTQHCFPKMLDLGRRGIGVFYVPSPKQYKF